MFLFYHSQQKENNTRQFKGMLFENLLAEYLDHCGYDVEIRKKHSSSEYDIEGEDRATKARLIGEAKAHNSSIALKDFAAFVGKLLPLGLAERKLTGLFLATGALTPEADDYYRSLSSFNIVARSGKDLLNHVRNALRLPDFDPLARQLVDKGYRPQQFHILSSDNGIFLVVTAGSTQSAAPAHFAVFQGDGQLLSDKSYLEKLADAVPELKALQPVVSSGYKPSEKERYILKGLLLGNEWTDYRFPAPPQFFVGRRDLIHRLTEHILNSASPNVIQIKSRSGVGKSSTFAYLENELANRGIITELHDARDVRSILDLYSLVQRFTDSATSPQDFRDVEEQLAALALKLDSSHAVFMVDQFESTFANPEVFQAYETLAALFLKFAPCLFLCFARKNDQITTYDDSKVSLEKLNMLSKPYELGDFDQKEAFELIERTNSSALKPVSKNVLAYVLEFAQGFPWLVKRTMAHIIRLSAAGVSQSELFAAGLRLDDLFDEELEGLDEVEKDYLTRIAARVPADYHDLHHQFDEDPLLPKILDKLTQSRLLRLSGATYDTYNDVFKEYLVYKKLPEFRQAIVYRKSPGTVLNTFRWTLDREVFTVEELEEAFSLSRGSAFNQIRELSALNLVRRDRGKWTVPRIVIDVYHQGRLGEYVRRQLAENVLVGNLINRVAQTESIGEEDLPEYLRNQFPFVNASDKTWNTYSAALLSWLTATKFVEILADGRLAPPSEDRSRIVEGLGNLSVIKARTGLHGRGGSESELFVPSSTWERAESRVGIILSGRWPLQREDEKVIRDLKHGHWLNGQQLTIDSIEQFKDQVRALLTSSAYSDLWEIANQGKPLLPIFERMIARSLTEGTMRWKLKKLLSWAKGVGIIAKRHYRYR